MTLAVEEYSPTQAALADLRHRFKDVVFDVTTTAGMKLARQGRAELVKLRTTLEDKRVEIKAPALERCRLIDAEAKRITAEIVSLEKPIDDLIKAEEERKANEKAERERIELARVEGIQSRIAEIGSAVAMLAGKPSCTIQSAIDATESLVIDETFAEFQPQAQAMKDGVLSKLRDMHAAAVEHEAEQVRIKAEREELARLRAEQEKREAEERARAEAERKRIETEERERRAKIEAEERAARERILEQQRKADEERAELDRIARESREAEERQARQRQAAEDARLKAERDRLEAQRREAEAKERKAREEAEAKEREERRKQAELMDGMQMLEAFVERYGKRTEFAGISAKIVAFLQKATTTA